jgi:hypothetical protein
MTQRRRSLVAPPRPVMILELWSLSSHNSKIIRLDMLDRA